MSYKTMGYSLIRRILANLDKCSCHGQSNVVRSPWGIFKMYRVGKNKHRYYSLRGSEVFANRGSLRIGTIRRMLLSLGK